MSRLAMVVRSDSGGLAWQTLALCQMLRPARIMVIDSTPFNSAEQHPERFDGYEGFTVKGFPSNMECSRLLLGMDAVMTCETPYNFHLFALARQRGIRALLMHNVEFSDNLNNSRMSRPHLFIAPSLWRFDEFKAKFPNTIHLPPPTFHQNFNTAREANFARTGRRRFLHVVGKPAAHDRAGMFALLEALEHTGSSFELVIKSQSPMSFAVADRRVRFDYTSPEDQELLYQNFDAVVYPRRYGGLSLVVNEALMSGLPVIMPDIDPNYNLLPADWLVPAKKTGEFMARAMVDIYSTDAKALAAKIDEFCAMSDAELSKAKADAFDIGYSNFSADCLRPRYKQLLEGGKL